MYPGAASAKIALTKASSGVVLPLLTKRRSPLLVAAVASPDSFTTASQVLPALRSARRPCAFACAVATSVSLATVSPALRIGAIAIWNA